MGTYPSFSKQAGYFEMHTNNTLCSSLRHETSYRQPSCPLGKNSSSEVLSLGVVSIPTPACGISPVGTLGRGKDQEVWYQSLYCAWIQGQLCRVLSISHIHAVSLPAIFRVPKLSISSSSLSKMVHACSLTGVALDPQPSSCGGEPKQGSTSILWADPYLIM